MGAGRCVGLRRVSQHARCSTRVPLEGPAGPPETSLRSEPLRATAIRTSHAILHLLLTSTPPPPFHPHTPFPPYPILTFPGVCSDPATPPSHPPCSQEARKEAAAPPPGVPIRPFSLPSTCPASEPTHIHTLICLENRGPAGAPLSRREGFRGFPAILPVSGALRPHFPCSIPSYTRRLLTHPHPLHAYTHSPPRVGEPASCPNLRWGSVFGSQLIIGKRPPQACAPSTARGAVSQPVST